MTDRKQHATKKAAARPEKAEGGTAVLAKIAAMPSHYRAMGERLHALVLRNAPAHQLIESAWYFTAMDDATEAKLSAIVHKFTS